MHELDGPEHADRKQLMLDAVEPAGVRACAREAGRLLDDLVDAADERTIDLHDALVVAYGAAALRWVGLRLPGAREAAVSREYARIVDGFGFAGRAYPRAWLARWRTDAWARRLVARARDGELPGTLVAHVAASDLPVRTAAVELGNLVRPTVAVAWLGCFATLAVRDQALQPDTWASRTPSERRSFLHEVRQTTPFVPALAARARADLLVDGVEVRAGERLVLDVRGIDLDPARHPGGFDGDRYDEADPPPYAFLPQGGGPVTGHRCPGEDLATALLAATVDVVLRRGLTPVASETVDLHRVPTAPGDGLLVQATPRQPGARSG